MAISSDNGLHFDAVVICLPGDIQAMIGSDGCIEVSYRYAGPTPGQFVAGASPVCSMFK